MSITSPNPAPPHAFAGGNRYAEQLAAQRRLLEVAREKTTAQGVQNEAQAASFASLQRGRATGGAVEQSLRLLASAASRRIGRWQDPATGEYDPADREVLLRQAAEMGLPAATAEAVLKTVAEAFHRRRAAQELAALQGPPPSAAGSRSRLGRAVDRLRRVRWFTWLGVGVVLIVLVASQAAFLGIWLKVLR